MTETISLVTGLLSGNGQVNLDSLLSPLVDIPTDGLVLFRYSIGVLVSSFNNSVIWNQLSATRAQIRGGRVLLSYSSRIYSELFVNRLSQTSQECENWLSRAEDTNEDEQIGEGSILVPITIGRNNLTPCDRIFYEFEPTVQGRFTLQGTYQLITNPDFRFTYAISGVPLKS